MTVATLGTWRAAGSSRSASAAVETIDRPRAAVAEDVAVVLDRVGGIGRHGDRADAHDRQVGDDPFRPVLGDQRHPVAAARRRARSRPRASRRTSRGDLAPSLAAGTRRRASPTETAVAAPPRRSKNIAGRLRQLA